MFPSTYLQTVIGILSARQTFVSQLMVQFLNFSQLLKNFVDSLSFWFSFDYFFSFGSCCHETGRIPAQLCSIQNWFLNSLSLCYCSFRFWPVMHGWESSGRIHVWPGILQSGMESARLTLMPMSCGFLMLCLTMVNKLSPMLLVSEMTCPRYCLIPLGKKYDPKLIFMVCACTKSRVLLSNTACL